MKQTEEPVGVLLVWFSLLYWWCLLFIPVMNHCLLHLNGLHYYYIYYYKAEPGAVEFWALDAFPVPPHLCLGGKALAWNTLRELLTVKPLEQRNFYGCLRYSNHRKTMFLFLLVALVKSLWIQAQLCCFIYFQILCQVGCLCETV